MPYKKTNEAWFGDSFNRSATLTFATADGASYDCAVNNVTLEQDLDNGLCSITADVASSITGSVAKGINSHAEGYTTVAYRPTTEIIEEKIETLKSRIDQLESTMNKKENKLRSTLKTLTYVREI